MVMFALHGEVVVRSEGSGEVVTQSNTNLGV